MVKNLLHESNVSYDINRGNIMLTIEVKQDSLKFTAAHSSKGNQLKWEQDGWWYKADEFGYESLAEAVTSHLLSKSNMEGITIYEPVLILYKGIAYRGCRSKNFRGQREAIITLERFIRAYTGTGLAKQLARIYDVKERICFTEEFVRKIAGLENFGEYIVKLMEMDAFFLNEDRHTNNISLIYNVDTDVYHLCPFYDMGLSLFADTRVKFPLNMDYFGCKEKITAKPFSRDFDEQLDAANELYGCHLKFNFPANRIADVILELKEQYLLTEEDVAEGRVDGYTEQEFRRVEDTLRYQASKYKYMFQE